MMQVTMQIVLDDQAMLPLKVWRYLVTNVHECSRCGTTNPPAGYAVVRSVFEAHHINHDETDHRIINGECLCVGCHRAHHEPEKTALLREMAVARRGVPRTAEARARMVATLQTPEVYERMCARRHLARKPRKLSDEQVSEIRTRRADGEPLQVLATEYGVSFQMISRIALGRARVAPRAGLDGPSRSTKVEPVTQPVHAPEPVKEPAKAPEPKREPVKV